MGFVKLEPRCLKSSAVLASIDPEPFWTLDDMLSELNCLELKLGSSSPSPLKQPEHWELSKREQMGRSGNKPFVMSISDDDMDDDQSDGEVSCDRQLMTVMTGTRFSCNDLYLSESEESDDEFRLDTTWSHLMDKKSLEEGVLFELEREHELKIKEQIRSKLSVLEAYQKNERKRLSSAMLRLEKYTEARRDMDRRADKQYQRKIAEILDSHLSAVQRDHEQRSQIEERRIRDDAALEEAKRKEKALYEEKVRQEKVKEEEKARLRAAKIAEEARQVALEAARRASEEAAEKEAARIRDRAAAEVAVKAAMEQRVGSGAETMGKKKEGDLVSKESGIRVMAADAALIKEANILKKYNDVAEKDHDIPQKDFDRYGRQIYRIIKNISGSMENVRAKAHALINIINDPVFPRSISILIFAKKFVSLCEVPTGSFDRTAFACGHVIVLVTSQVPAVMDFVLAEFHKACIYTVPKHLHPSDAASKTKDYLKMIGYREEDKNMENSDSYLNRVQSYMKLYAAIIQTEIVGIRNPHGLEEGWAWLAMFLNKLPANRYTAFALDAFLRMAGFALHRRYKSQFVKILDVISRTFLPALKGQEDQKIVSRLEQYLDDKIYLREPEGWRLQSSLLSGELAA